MSELRSGDDRRDHDPADDPAQPDDRTPLDEESTRPRRSVALLLIAVLGAWKIYEAFAAETAAGAIPPSLYTLGLAAFAISILGPRPCSC